MASSPDSRVPRMEDVAREAGVALGTVSNVLNRPQKVSPKVQAKVHKAIADLGFVPNRAARVLAAGTSSTIGFVVVDLSNSFFLDMTRGAEREAALHGLNLLLANSDVDFNRERAYLELFAQERVAGVLLAPVTTSQPVPTAIPHAFPLHTVLLNSDATEDACTVGVDNELGGYLAARHLIELGRSRLMFAGSPDFARPVGQRFAGVKRAIDEVPTVGLELMPTDEVQAEDGRAVGRAVLDRQPSERPDGIIASADLLAFGIVQAFLSTSEVRVPQDIAVTGYDNNRAAWDSGVPITTLAQPGEESGAVAMRMLMDELREGRSHVHTHTVLSPKLLVRESTVPRSS